MASALDFLKQLNATRVYRPQRCTLCDKNGHNRRKCPQRDCFPPPPEYDQVKKKLKPEQRGTPLPVLQPLIMPTILRKPAPAPASVLPHSPVVLADPAPAPAPAPVRDPSPPRRARVRFPTPAQDAWDKAITEHESGKFILGSDMRKHLPGRCTCHNMGEEGDSVWMEVTKDIIALRDAAAAERLRITEYDAMDAAWDALEPVGVLPRCATPPVYDLKLTDLEEFIKADGLLPLEPSVFTL
jgi:hypothetical protein